MLIFIYHASSHSTEFLVLLHNLVDVDNVVSGPESQEVTVGRKFDDLDGLRAVLQNDTFFIWMLLILKIYILSCSYLLQAVYFPGGGVQDHPPS